jgi:hypothetical protein
MPVPITSRYRSLPVIQAGDGRGQPHATVAIRPNDPALPSSFRYRLSSLETLEYVAWRQFGNSQAWWRIADANPLVFPLDWRPGDPIALPAAADAGRVERTRRF